MRAMGWRGVGDVGSALFFLAALARMPFADLMGILQMTPLSLTAASALFLGEHIGWRRWTAVVTGFAGALLVIKPGSSAFNAWGATGCAVGAVRYTTRRLHAAPRCGAVAAADHDALTAGGVRCLLGVRGLEGAECGRAVLPSSLPRCSHFSAICA